MIIYKLYFLSALNILNDSSQQINNRYICNSVPKLMTETSPAFKKIYCIRRPPPPPKKNQTKLKQKLRFDFSIQLLPFK